MYLRICHLEGFYGMNCLQECQCHNDATCDPANGECSCTDGWAGADCSVPCPSGEEKTCLSSCPCVHGVCAGASTKCTCHPGYTGAFCSEKCPFGTYGKKCAKKCLCVHGCDSRTGTCIRCPAGQSGELCEQSCPLEKWGQNCSNHCSCSESSECNNVDGSCQCYNGFTGPKCNQECPAGKWGTDCSQTCSQCRNNSKCDPVDGECRCPAGYKGENCELACGLDQWGMDCMNECKCASDRKLCNPVTGLMGDLCNKYCPEGSWGPDCAFRCFCKMENSKCQATTGRCDCHPGFTGRRCDQACPEGFWGEQCANVCDCGEDFCDPVVGCCNKNNRPCGPTKLEYNVPEKSNVAAMVISVVSLLVVTIALAVLVLYYRKKYMRERDPIVPTITYHPTAINGGRIVTKNEFNNPLYQKTSNSQLATKGDSEHLANSKKSSGPQNNCAKFDDVYAEIDSSFGDERNGNFVKRIYDYEVPRSSAKTNKQ
uniref:EGF-like domain-containing protein n=1 Tax=Setaria digitata TaxID=48799 RepID=A0A915Q1P9_9BILA